MKTTFFFPVEINQEVAEKIGKEVARRCAPEATVSVRHGDTGWFIDLTNITKMEKGNLDKIYPFLFGAEFALRRLK